MSKDKVVKKKKITQMVIDFIAFLILVAIDQVTKYLVLENLKDRPAIELIKGVFELRYLENRGAAFGVLQNAQIFFIFIAVVMMTIILFVLIKMPTSRKYYPWHWFLVMLAAGGIGNMIDRIRLNYVVDFLYFSLIDFPIFNFADIFVSVGTVMLFIIVLFFTKEEDLAFINLSIQKKRSYRSSK